MLSPPPPKVAININIDKKAGPVNHPQTDDWRRYPFRWYRGIRQLDFPAAEANHPDCESDTWFLAGELTGESGRGYAFLSIFNKNRPGLGDIVADFYTFALFDLDAGAYGTYTDYDMPPAKHATRRRW